MPFEALTPEIACELLRAAGVSLVPSAVRVEPREERWLVRLPGQRVAWIAASESGRSRMQTERRVLRLLQERCSFLTPRVVLESEDGDLDLRAMVPGSSDARRIYNEVGNNAELAVALGTAIGAILAEQHMRIRAEDIAGWLPGRPTWPEPRAWIVERLRGVLDDPRLIARATAVIDAYEDVDVSESDRVLVHTDVGFHNLGIDPQSHVVHGIFDYDGAAWADRHHDFRYLVFDRDQDELLEAALDVYEPRTGRRIDRERVLLYNAACAITFLAYRAGTKPEERSCGRTLAEDLRWSTHAIARAELGTGRSGS